MVNVLTVTRVLVQLLMKNVIEIAVINRAYHVAYLIINKGKLFFVEVIGALESIAMEYHHVLLVQHFLRVNHLKYNAFEIKP